MFRRLARLPSRRLPITMLKRARWAVEPGATLILDLDGSTGLATRNAVGLDGATQHLEVASNPSIQGGNVDWAWAGWVLLGNKAATYPIAGKERFEDDGSHRREFRIFYSSAADRMRMFISTGSGSNQLAQVDAEELGSPPTGEWCFVLGWHNSVNNRAGLVINGNTPTVIPRGGTAGVNDDPFRLGAARGIPPLLGRLDEVAWFKAPPGGIANIIGDLQAYLYNGGSGRRYGDLSEAQKTAFGLVSWWPLGEGEQLGTDLHGSNHLTSIGTPTWADGRVSGPPTIDGQLVWRWSGQDGAVLQGDPARRPTWHAEDGVIFDGVNDGLDADEPLVVDRERFSVLIRVRPDALPTTDPAVLFDVGTLDGSAVGRLAITPEGRVVASYRPLGGTLASATSVAAVTVGEWHTIGLRRDRTNLQVFIDGKPSGAPATIDAGADFTGAVTRLGGPIAASGFEAFQGAIRRIQGWDNALADARLSLPGDPVVVEPPPDPDPDPDPPVDPEAELISLVVDDSVEGTGLLNARLDDGYVIEGPTVLSGDTWTVAAWVEMPDPLPVLPAIASIFWQEVRGQTGSSFGVRLTTGYHPSLAYRLNTGTTHTLGADVALTAGQRALIVAVRDGDTMRLSVNGGAFQEISGLGTEGLPGSNHTALFGRLDQTNPRWFFPGTIATLAVFNGKALSISETDALYHGGEPLALADLPVEGCTDFIEPTTYEIRSQADPNKVWPFRAVPGVNQDDWLRPMSDAATTDRCLIGQYVRHWGHGEHRFTFPAASTPQYWAAPDHLDLGGVCSGSCPTVLVSGTDYDLSFAGNLPTPEADEQLYAQVSEDGSGFRVVNGTNGKLRCEAFDGSGAITHSAEAPQTTWPRATVIGSETENVDPTSQAGGASLGRPVTRIKLFLDGPYDFASNDLVRIESNEVSYANDWYISELADDGSWITYAVDGHDQPAPEDGAIVQAVGHRARSTMFTSSPSEIGELHFEHEPMFLGLRIKVRGERVEFFRRGVSLGHVDVPGFPAASSEAVSWLGTDPDSPYDAPHGMLLGFTAGSGSSASQERLIDLSNSVVLTCRNGWRNEATVATHYDLAYIDRKRIQEYDILTIFRDAETGELIDGGYPGHAIHPDTGQAYGIATYTPIRRHVGTLDLTGPRQYTVDLLVVSPVLTESGDLADREVLFYGRIATLTRRPLDARWESYLVDPSHPDASDENDGSSESPLATITEGIRRQGIYTRLMLKSGINYGEVNQGNLSSSRLIGPAIVESDTDSERWQVERLLIGSRSHRVQWRNAYVKHASGSSAVVNLSSNHRYLSVQRFYSETPTTHFNGGTLALDYGGVDLCHQTYDRTDPPADDYGFFFDRQIRNMSVMRNTYELINTQQHLFRCQVTYGVEHSCYGCPDPDLPRGGGHHTITFRGQKQFLNCHDTTDFRWKPGLADWQYRATNFSAIRYERTHASSLIIRNSSGLYMTHTIGGAMGDRGIEAGAMQSTGGQSHILGWQRNVVLGCQILNWHGSSINRFHVRPTEGPWRVGLADGDSFGPLEAPGVAMAERSGDTVILATAGAPYGGERTQFTGIQWQRSTDGGPWVDLPGRGALVSPDWPGPGSHRYRAVAVAGDSLAFGPWSEPITVLDPAEGD